jgi:hypothetical protein
MISKKWRNGYCTCPQFHFEILNQRLRIEILNESSGMAFYLK